MKFEKQIGIAVSGNETDLEIFRIDVDLSKEQAQAVLVARDEVVLLVQWLSDYLEKSGVV